MSEEAIARVGLQRHVKKKHQQQCMEVRHQNFKAELNLNFRYVLSLYLGQNTMCFHEKTNS
jgi:hypothetical protein